MPRWINDDTYGTLKLEAQIHPYVQDHSPAVLTLGPLRSLNLAVRCSAMFNISGLGNDSGIVFPFPSFLFIIPY